MSQVRPEQIGVIYERWVADGEPYCEHASRATVQDMGCPPEDYCCLRCGETWSMGRYPVPPPRGVTSEDGTLR